MATGEGLDMISDAAKQRCSPARRRIYRAGAVSDGRTRQ